MVLFLTHGPGAGISFSPTELTFTLSSGSPGMSSAGDMQHQPSTPVTAHLRFLATSSESSLAPEDLLPGWTNYLQGSDPAQWHTHIPTYAGITYSKLYPGVDLEYTGAGGHLKGTYIIAPGADPALIRWRYEDAASVQVDQAGNLLVKYRAQGTGGGQTAAPSNNNTSLLFTEQAPVAWQEIYGQRTPVQANYIIDYAGNIGFSLGRYDATHPLIIDPTLVYSTFFGGIGEESGYGIAVGASGDIYLTGYTSSSHTFPPMNPLEEAGLGYWDAFVTRLSSDGRSMIFSTYLTGTDWDVASGLALDSVGNVYVCGETTSTDFPLRNPIQASYGGGTYDGFVTELSATGDMLFSTYLGGRGLDRAHGLGVDKLGKIIVAGYTDSTNFPLEKPLQSNFGGGFSDTFVARLDPTTSKLVYSTFLGGNNIDYGWGVAVNDDGTATVTGYTSSRDFPTRNAYQVDYKGGAHDIFVSKLAPDGSSLIYSTFLGGLAEDLGESVATDQAGNAFVTGYTFSQDFPTANAFQPQFKGTGSSAFVTKLNPTGSALVYSTYLGGSASTPDIGDQGLAITVGADGSAYVAGATGATDFPLANALQPTLAGKADAFLTKINPAGSALDYSTYLGGAGEDYAFAVAVDRGGNAYITGSTHSSNFPTAKPFQRDMFGSGDLFMSKISETPNAIITPQIVRTPYAVPTYIYVTDDDGNPAPNALPFIGAPPTAEVPVTPGTSGPLEPVDETATPLPQPLVTVSPGSADPQSSQSQTLVWIMLLTAGAAVCALFFLIMRGSILKRPPQ